MMWRLGRFPRWPSPPLEFIDGRAIEVDELLLQRRALIDRRALYFAANRSGLLHRCHAAIEVRFQTFKLLLLLFLFFDGFLCCGTLLGDEFFEVRIGASLGTRLHPQFRFPRRAYLSPCSDNINSRLQRPLREVPVLVGFQLHFFPCSFVTMIVTSGKGLPSWSLTSPTIELVPRVAPPPQRPARRQSVPLPGQE